VGSEESVKKREGVYEQTHSTKGEKKKKRKKKKVKQIRNQATAWKSIVVDC
jgi:hypothetical protein